MAEKILKIKIGEEYKVKVENIGEFNESMFKDLYDKAFDCINLILKSKTKSEYEKYNNIVAYVGERGTGKTSAMLSVSDALKDGKYAEFLGDNEKNKDRKYINEVYDELKKDKKFFDIGVIDPSHFDRNSNILEIILAKMFKKFKGEIEKSRNREVNHDKKRNLIKAFEEVFENLKTIQNPEDIYKGESLDALLKMSASTDLKKNMTDLVGEYLDFFNGCDYKANHVLLIEIDDMDLNTKHAYKMVEQIRKYLIIPNVVILMAVKMQQLSHVVEKNTRKEFKILLDKGHMNIEEPKNMAEKYLMKLIPLERRLFLPNFDNINLDMIMEVKNKKNSIEKSIRKNIYDKTGMMFFNTTTQVSYIVPRNLREIVNLVSQLEKMPIPEKEVSNRREIKTKNFHEFREYFLNHWVEENLKENHKSIIKEIYTRDVEEKNKYVVRILDEIYGNKVIEQSNREGRITEYKQLDEYLSIINFLNNSENISLGDILLILEVINKSVKRDSDKKFIFAIKTLYSILLYDYIRGIKSEDSEKNIKMSVLKYKKLINGYIRNKVIHKNNFIITSEIEEDDSYKELYKENNKVIEWLDHFIIRRKYKSTEENEKKSRTRNGTRARTKLDNIRTLERKFEYEKDEIMKKNGFDFEIYGFLFNNIQEILETEGSLYIGNIEMLERMLKFKYTQLENISFYDKTTGFIKELLQHIDETIQKSNDFTNVKLIEDDGETVKNKFLSELIFDDELREEICKIYGYNYLNYTKYKEDISFKTNIVNKDAFKGDIESIKKKLEDRNIENINDINEALDKFKDEIIKERYEGEDKEVLQLKMRSVVSKASKKDKFISDIETTIKVKCMYYMTTGRNKYDSEDYEEAVLDLDRAIELNPKNAIYYNNRGKCRYKQEKWEEAEKDYDKAINLDSNKAEYYFGRGSCKFKQEKYEEAEKDYEEAIKLDSNQADYYAERGNCKYKQEKYEEAEKDCSEAINLNPSKAKYYFGRGNCKFKQEKYEEAEKDYDKAINLDSREVDYYITRGDCKRLQEKHKEAIKDYEKVLELEKNNERAKKSKEKCLKQIKLLKVNNE